MVGLPWSAVNLDRAELDIGWQLQRVGGRLLHRVTMNVYTEVSDAKTLNALKRLGRQLGS